MAYVDGHSEIAPLTSKIAPQFQQLLQLLSEGQNRTQGGEIAPVEKSC